MSTLYSSLNTIDNCIHFSEAFFLPRQVIIGQQFAHFDNISSMLQNFFFQLVIDNMPDLPGNYICAFSALGKVVSLRNSPSNGSLSTHHSCSSNLALYCSIFLAFFQLLQTFYPNSFSLNAPRGEVILPLTSFCFRC